MNYRHLPPRWALGALMLAATIGCWTEVEYTEPDAATQAETQAQPAEPTAGEPSQPAESTTVSASDSTADAGGFGDDLAQMLANDESPPADESADVTPIPEADSQSPAVVGDRYAAGTPAATPSAEISIFDEPPAEPATEPPAEPSSEPPGETVANVTPPAANTSEALLDEPVDADTPPGSPVSDSMPAEEREAIAESTDEVIPNLNDDEIPTPPTVAAWNTRRAAWLLGSKLSLAALANDYGGSVEKVQALFAQSRDLASMLNVPLADLPARPAATAAVPDADAALNYLFAEGQKIGRELAGRQGTDHAALFEVAVKSNILLVLYQPGAPTAQAIAKSIEQAGARAKLPATLWQPLVDALTVKASLADVRAAVYRLHADTDKYLDQPPQP